MLESGGEHTNSQTGYCASCESKYWKSCKASFILAWPQLPVQPLERKGLHRDRLFSSGLDATWPFNHIWKPVFLKSAHFVGRMYACKLLSAGSLQSHSGICYAGIQPVCGCSAPLKFVPKTTAWDDWRSSWNHPKSVFKHKLREKWATKKQSRFTLSNCTSGQSLLRALSTFYHQKTDTGFVLGYWSSSAKLSDLLSYLQNSQGLTRFLPETTWKPFARHSGHLPMWCGCWHMNGLEYMLMASLWLHFKSCIIHRLEARVNGSHSTQFADISRRS